MNYVKEIKKGQTSRDTIYKLYYDCSIKPTKDFIYKPLAAGISTFVGMNLFDFNNMNDTIQYLGSGFIGFCTYFTVNRTFKYMIQKRNYNNQIIRLNEFIKEFKNEINKDAEIETNQILMLPMSVFVEKNNRVEARHIMFLNGNAISEIYENDKYTCTYYDEEYKFDKQKNGIDITNLALKVLKK